MTRLEAYRRISGLTYRELGEPIGRTSIQVQRYCKALDDPRHNVPHSSINEPLRRLTHGVIHLGNYADKVTPAEAAAMMAEIARLEAEAAA